MTRTFHFLLAVLFLFFLQGCKKDSDDLISHKPDDSFFLNSTQYMFGGTISDSSVLWRYGVYEFQRGNTSTPFGNNEQLEKSLTFWLTSNEDLTTRFEINTPVYSVVPDDLFSKVLTLGEKEIGSLYQKFELKLTLSNITYSTNGDQTNSVLKILKMEKSKDEFNRDIVLVWFKVNCKFYSTVDTTSFPLKDGYILAGFMYNL